MRNPAGLSLNDVGESFVRLIPFKAHVNVVAAAVLAHKEELGGYKNTPKGMLQIYLKQAVLLHSYDKNGSLISEKEEK